MKYALANIFLNDLKHRAIKTELQFGDFSFVPWNDGLDIWITKFKLKFKSEDRLGRRFLRLPSEDKYSVHQEHGLASQGNTLGPLSISL